MSDQPHRPFTAHGANPTEPPMSPEELEAVADAAFLRLNVNVAGTTPIFNYYAYATSYQGR